MKDAAEHTIGFKERQRKNHWYDSECAEVVKLRKVARNQWLGDPSNEELARKMKESNQTAKRILRQKKRENLNRNLDCIDRDRREGNIRAHYQGLKHLKKSFQPRTSMIKDSNGEVRASEKEVTVTWEKYFKELLNRPEPNDPIQEQSYQLAENFSEIPSREEVRKAITNLKNNKAPGKDNIPAELFKRGGETLEGRMTDIIRKIWREERIPSTWTEGIIIPIHKKGDRMICANYRGITLLQTGYKILTRIIYNRIKVYSEEIIGDYQCAFRKCRSTTDHIFTIKQIMEKYWEYDRSQYHLFIDFKQAYDSIHRPSMWKIMQEFGIPSKLIRMTQVCIQDSKAQVRVGGMLSNPFDIESGLRQGCVLSALLFNLVMEKVTRTIINREEGIQLDNIKINDLTYADDVDLIAENDEDLINMVNTYKGVAEKIGLQINYTKTKLMCMSRRNNNNNRNFEIDQESIERVTKFKYLGVTITDGNKMNEEINARISAANRSFYSLRDIMKRKNISRSTKLRTYNSIIRPIALHASETWVLTKRLEQRLMVFENTILRNITGPIFDREEERWRRRHNWELRQETKQERIIDVVKRNKLRWAGHVARMEENRIPRKVMNACVEGRRPRGRPRMRWIDGVKEEVRKRNSDDPENWMEIAQDRRRWRDLMLADMDLQEVQDPPE